jgi:DNA-directed RNA polymerase I, II, and III subunit RPABC2
MLIEGELADDDDDDENKKESIYIDPNKRITSPYMSNYERTRLISDRATQLASGGQPMIKNREGSINLRDLDHKTIAKIELESGTIPLYIERELPNGRIEVWYVNEMTLKKREFVQKGKGMTNALKSRIKKIKL